LYSSECYESIECNGVAGGECRGGRRGLRGRQFCGCGCECDELFNIAVDA